MPHSYIDHLVVTAPALAVGAAFLQHALGAEPQPGGEHPAMATHNCLLRLGDSLYIEVISPNQDAVPPGRPRWFGLDRTDHTSLPSLSAWVVRVPDIEAAVRDCSEALGEIAPMSRGSLNWRITIPSDGLVPVDGVAPALIEWRTEQHPAGLLCEQGLSLTELTLHHPEPARIERLLTSLQLDGPVSVRPVAAGGSPGIRAKIQTPHGICLL